MTAGPVPELLRAMPFVRFELHLANGKVVRVNHPDFASLQPSGRILIVWRESDEGFDIIDLLLVNNVTVAPPPQAAA
jgi:hypothetical protein